MNAFTLFILYRLLGYSHEQCAVILAGPKTARNLAMRGLAIMLGSAAFTYGAFQFTHNLLAKDWLPALAFSVFCGAMLLLVELYNLDEFLTTGRMSRKVLATRATVIVVMLMASLFAAVGPMQTSIDAHLAQARQASAHALENDSRFKAQLDSARAATEQASKDVVREKQLLAKLNALNTEYAAAKASADNEREGNVGTDGRKRVTGCGPICRGWELEATRIDAERTAVSHEHSALAGSATRLASGQGALDKVSSQIDAETAVLNGGATSHLSAMLELLWQSGVAKAIVLFFLLLSTLPELLTVNALSTARDEQQAILSRLNALESTAMEAAVQRLRVKLRDGQERERQTLTEGSRDDLLTRASANTKKTEANAKAEEAQQEVA